MMKSGKLFLMEWFAKCSIIILTQLKCPTMSNLKFRTTSQMLTWLINHLGFPKSNIIDVQLHEVKLFDTIMPKQMAEYQKRDTQLSHVYECVASNSKPKLTVIHHIKSRPVHRLLLQYD